LLAAARTLADGGSQQGQLLRSNLLATTGLSRAGIELAITRCLETHASVSEMTALLGATPQARAAHVLLSGNVFVAALRAIVIATASSERVFVRTSRRDPTLAKALHGLVPGAFTLVSELQPSAGDHVWAYGSDETLARVRSTLPRGSWFHAHGHGFGVALVEPSVTADLAAAAHAIALDTALFDQRGCLSPRLVCVVGTLEQARAVARALATALAALERDVPPGPSSPEEAAESRRAHDTATYAFETLAAGSSWLSVGTQVVVAPPSRSLHVVSSTDPLLLLAPFARQITSLGASVSAPLYGELQQRFPGARLAKLGQMQRPALDGPVDRRRNPWGEQI
jgi:hypothetical protein